MSIQYSISYDETGSPSLVKNTIEGPKQVVRTSFNIGKFEPKRTISDFANVSSFDDIEVERGVEPVTKSLQKYVYQQTTNSDGDPDNTTQTKTFSQMDFDARVAKDPITGKVLGSPLTFMEQIKVDAQAFSEKKGAQTILGFTDFGTISGLFARYGRSVTLDEYKENHPDYYTTGFGQYTPPSERTGLTRAQKEAISIDKQQRLGIDSGTGIKDPSDYLQEQAAKERQQELRDLQSSIDSGAFDSGKFSDKNTGITDRGRGNYGGGNGGNQGGGDLSGTEGSF